MSIAGEATLHVLVRTSPKGPGQKFVGRCILCGKEGVDFAAFATEACPNPDGVSQDDSLLKVLEMEDDK